MSKPRIWISNKTPQLHEIVRVRALIEHRMESGIRLSSENKLIPRNIVNLFEVKMDDELLFSWQPETAISQNPYIEFTFIARKTGTLHLKWIDDENTVITDSLELKLNA